jgi:hypothetical protein
MLAAMLYSAPGPARDHVWIVGGGYEPQNSQAQIEQNVIWARQVLAAAPGARKLTVFFTDGNAPGRDVKVWEPRPETTAAWQPFARVFAGHELNGEYYRNHRVAGVASGTEAGALRERLAREFGALTSADRALFIFNGHGGYDRKNTARNTIQLWNNTSLNARDMEALFSKIDPAVPARFVFTQCYAGGFARLARAGAGRAGALSPANRCGFMAEAEDRPAEGCSAGVNANDYRDYTTYFFAALSGRTRQGRALPVNPDRDGDGRVSLYEAHLYALRVAESADLPRSTSEDFLEHWRPGVLGWARRLAHEPAPLDDRANPYTSLAEEVARELALPAAANERRRLIEQRMQAYQDEDTRQDEEYARLEREVVALQRAIQHDVALRWPEVMAPHTAAYHEFLNRDRDAAQKFIVRHVDYPTLVKKQTRLMVLTDESLDTSRKLTRLEMVERLEMLARQRGRFAVMASDTDKAAYDRLRACEEQGL